MRYDWDDTKRLTNLGKHQVDFGEIENFDWDNAISEPSSRYGEERWTAYGYMYGLLHAVVYTDRDEVRRIISVRRANARERKRYGYS